MCERPLSRSRRRSGDPALFTQHRGEHQPQWGQKDFEEVWSEQSESHDYSVTHFQPGALLYNINTWYVWGKKKIPINQNVSKLLLTVSGTMAYGWWLQLWSSCAGLVEWTKMAPWPSTGMSGGTTSCLYPWPTWRMWRVIGNGQWWIEHTETVGRDFVYLGCLRRQQVSIVAPPAIVSGV